LNRLWGHKRWREVMIVWIVEYYLWQRKGR
jgi:hypothetical protein